ncbi:hypothetical protein I6N95_26290 [Vagococcus sp. BWB3-3]|uniref:Uncharacterized protein n=1 Tax=Vagococcus allomyrinae TaxID=2794353 RepID=A0A940PA15_9ENTE|nr:hypothetical protein [Vagococcus allomyrinae]MBP1044524.1 hypothetical protein [Vagococcus allomyrinae]
MEIRPKFKYISQSTEFIPAEFKGTSYTTLPVNGVVVKTISGDAPIEFLDQLKQNKGEDITFEIRDLGINDEKVNNSN